MSRRYLQLIAILLTSLYLTGCAPAATQTVAPTLVPTASQTPAATQTPAPTHTPTEIPLPEGALRELQTRLGEKYQLTSEGDGFVIQGIDNLKFSPDGTAQLAWEFQGATENLTVAFQAIDANGEALNIGPWQHTEDGGWKMLVAGAPKTVEEADSFPKLAIVEGHPKEAEMDRTVHDYVRMALEKSDTYNPQSEFEGIVLDGKEIDLVNPLFWYSSDISVNSMKGTEFSVDEYNAPMLIALERGFFKLEIVDVSGQQTLGLLGLPIVIKNPDGSIMPMVALTNDNEFSGILELVAKVRKNDYLLILLKTTEIGEHDKRLSADESLQRFVVKANQALFDKKILKFNMLKLPQELSNMGFWVLMKLDAQVAVLGGVFSAILAPGTAQEQLV